MATQTEQRPDRTRRRRPRMAHALCSGCDPDWRRFLCGKPRPVGAPLFRVPPSGFSYCVVCRDLARSHACFDS